MLSGNMFRRFLLLCAFVVSIHSQALSGSQATFKDLEAGVFLLRHLQPNSGDTGPIEFGRPFLSAEYSYKLSADNFSVLLIAGLRELADSNPILAAEDVDIIFMGLKALGSTFDLSSIIKNIFLDYVFAEIPAGRSDSNSILYSDIRDRRTKRVGEVMTLLIKKMIQQAQPAKPEAKALTDILFEIEILEKASSYPSGHQSDFVRVILDAKQTLIESKHIAALSPRREFGQQARLCYRVLQRAVSQGPSKFRFLRRATLKLVQNNP